jgi:hypothetical protein
MMGLTTFLLEAAMRPPIIKMQCSFLLKLMTLKLFEMLYNFSFWSLSYIVVTIFTLKMQYILKWNDETKVTFR